jgi:hypothetical protein
MFDQQMAQHGFIPFDYKTPNFFPVGLAPVYDALGKEVPGYKRVERGDTGDTLAVHSDAYSLVPYERHFQLFEDAIAKSALNTTDMQVGTDMERNGAKIFRQYLFPNERAVITNRRGERELKLRIFMFDSYDGSSSLVGRSGFFDMVCCNMAFMGKSLADVKFRHVGDMDAKVQVAAQQLTDAAEDFQVQAKRLATWTTIPVTPLGFGELVATMPQSNQKLVDQMTAEFARNN